MYSCEKHPLPPPYYMIRQNFYIIDSAGNDLLSTDNEKLDIFSIKIYNLTNGRVELNSKLYQNNGYRPDITYGFGILKDDSQPDHHLLYIDLNGITSNDKYSYTVIDWNGHHRDTIKAKVEITSQYTRITMVSYNDSVWSPKSSSEPFTIIK